MSSATEELAALQRLYPAAYGGKEGTLDVAYIPGLLVGRAGHKSPVLALLYPHLESGYPTRLYLDRQVATTEPKSWQTRVVSGETWWSISWMGVPNSLPWTEILANHLKGLQ
jgi:hypothetical protein